MAESGKSERLDKLRKLTRALARALTPELTQERARALTPELKLELKLAQELAQELKLELKLARALGQEMASGAIAEDIATSPLSLYFDLDAFGPDDITEVLAFLSDLYRDVGGDRLVIEGMTTLEASPVLDPMEV